MLTDGNYDFAAKGIGCDSGAVKAVCHVEAGCIGFYADGRIILKFEGHKFHAFTHGKYDISHPTISYPKWTEKYSGDGEAAYTRFNIAFSLDPKAAMMATSWGMFQIMGEHYAECSFKDVGSFVTYLKQSEYFQLLAFCTFVKTTGLGKYMCLFKTTGLAACAGFALRYNGREFEANQYHIKIFKAYNSYKK